MLRNIKVQDDYVENLATKIEESSTNDSNLAISLYEGTSKKGAPFKAVKVVIGEYETLIFPNKFEMKYIETVL